MKYLLLFLFLFFLSGCLKESSPFVDTIQTEPALLNDGWVLSTPSTELMDEQKLTEIIYTIHSEEELWQLKSLLVFRNEKLVAETYFKDENDRTRPQPIWSCTKQIMGLLTGIAIQEDVLSSIEDPISLYLEQELQNHPDKRAVTINNLLSMQGGLGFDESKDVSTLLQRKPDNVIDFILDRALIFSPGQTFNYNSGEPHLIAASIQNAVGRSLDEWADDVLFSKIGFNNYTWLSYDGYPYGGFGISTTPRELAKVAQLVLNQGYWQGEQVVDSAWIQDMVSPQALTGDGSDFMFGHLWWVNPDFSAYLMAGSGGQYACVLPNEQLLVVITAEHDTDGDFEIDFEVFMDIVQKIRDTAS